MTEKMNPLWKRFNDPLESYDEKELATGLWEKYVTPLFEACKEKGISMLVRLEYARDARAEGDRGVFQCALAGGGSEDFIKIIGGLLAVEPVEYREFIRTKLIAYHHMLTCGKCSAKWQKALSQIDAKSLMAEDCGDGLH